METSFRVVGFQQVVAPPHTTQLRRAEAGVASPQGVFADKTNICFDETEQMEMGLRAEGTTKTGREQLKAEVWKVALTPQLRWSLKTRLFSHD